MQAHSCEPETSKQIFQHNRKYIPGGVMALLRKIEPELAFGRVEGACLSDADNNRYIDYHAAFGHGSRPQRPARDRSRRSSLKTGPQFVWQRRQQPGGLFGRVDVHPDSGPVSWCK